MERIVDTHCHFWWRETNSWLDESWDVLYQDYTPVEHQAASRPVGVTRCVIVEAGDTDVDNQTIMDLAAEYDFVGALILRASLDDPRLGDTLDQWQKLPKFRGMRMNFEAHPDPDIATKPAVIEGLKELERRGLIHDFLPLVRHLDGIATSLEQVPDLKCIVEHYGKPDFDGTMEPAWEQAMRRIARDTNANCKLSLSPQVTRFQEYLDHPQQGWPIEAMRQYTACYLEELGPDRLMFGSDWPVALLTTDYAGMLATHRDLLGPLDPEVEVKLFRTNAEAFYNVTA